MNFYRNIHPLLRNYKDKNKQNDTNHAILNAIATMLEEAEKETLESKHQSSLKSATGDYLDYWGDFFGIYRRTEDEDDTMYRERIVRALDVPRGTNNALSLALKDFFDDRTLGVYVYEPWEDIFILDTSKLDGGHHIPGEYYRHAVIDIHIGSPFDEAVVSVINDFKPAGVLFHLTYDPSLGSEDRILSLGKYGTFDHTQLTANPSETTLDMAQPLKQAIRGTLQMNQARDSQGLFKVDKDYLNSERVLGGAHFVYDNFIHLAGQGRYSPKFNDTFREFLLNGATSTVEPEFYTNVSEEGEQEKLNLSPHQPLNLMFNVGAYLQGGHPKLKQFEGDYETALSEAQMQVQIQGSPGIQVRLEYFNFNNKRWTTIGSLIGGNTFDNLLADLPDKGFLNKHSNLYLRAITNTSHEVTLRNIRLNYNSESLREKGNAFGYGLEVLSEGTQIPRAQIGDGNLFVELGEGYIGDAMLEGSENTLIDGNH